MPLRLFNRFALGLLIASMLTPCAVCAQPTPPDLALGFRVGEVLRYRLKWGVVPVGTARIDSEWTEDTPPLLRLRVHVRSNAFLDRIYRIEDTVESAVDPASFLPIRFEKNMHEGGVHRRDVIFFDRQAGRVVWNNLLQTEQRSYPAPREVRDILSLMFALRSVPFAPGEVKSYVIAGDDGPTPVRVSIQAQTFFHHDRYGRIPALQMKPEVGSDGLFLGRIPRELWISADAPYVLLQLSVEAPIGQVHLLLDEIEGHPSGPWPGGRTRHPK